MMLIKASLQCSTMDSILSLHATTDLRRQTEPLHWHRIQVAKSNICSSGRAQEVTFKNVPTETKVSQRFTRLLKGIRSEDSPSVLP
jgi:hypothetical protein